MKLYYKLRDFIFPHDSRRRFLAKLFKKAIKNPRLYLRYLNISNIKRLINMLKADDGAVLNNKLDNFDAWFRSNNAIELIVDTNVVNEKTEDNSQEIETEVIDNCNNQQLNVTYEELVFDIVNKPLVSIIIPVYNQIDYTYKCLKSILDHTKDIAYEIIIADDVSSDNTKIISTFVKNITVVRNSCNQGFLLNCNRAAKLARGKYIHFLNNDTQVQPNWLSSLIKTIESDNTIGMVGSKLVYPDGRLQEAGGILWKDGSAWNFGYKSDPTLPEFNYLKEVDYISGASILIRTDLWNQLDGFDEEFAPAYCEDSDLAFSVRKAGYKVVYQPKSVVVHFEGISNGTDTSTGMKHYQVVNSEKFYKKWKDVLEKEHFNNAENVFLARDRSRNKPCILFIDHYVPTFDKDAGSRTIYQYLQLLAKEGYNVKFIGDNFNRMEPYGQMVEDLGVEILYGVYYRDNWKKWLQDNAKYIKYAFINRPHISVNYIDELNKNNIPVVYDVCDLHFVREERCYKLTGKKEHLDNSKKFREIELGLFNKSTKVVSVSKDEKDIINEVTSSKKAYVAPIFVFNKFDFESKQDRKDTKDLMFVGGFTHTPNLDAMLWFLEEVFPKISSKIPNIKMNVVGSNVPEKIKDLASDNIIIKGFVTDEELEHLYKTTRISVIPLRYGAGVKGKTIEAMYNKIPIVSTSIGIEGLENIEKCIGAYDDADSFANEVVKMYTDDKYRERNVSACYKYVYEHYSYDIVKNWFKELFDL
ncbi:MAG: glycosyltransferase [Succinivibrionaceae bacterium]